MHLVKILIVLRYFNVCCNQKFNIYTAMKLFLFQIQIWLKREKLFLRNIIINSAPTLRSVYIYININYNLQTCLTYNLYYMLLI